LPGVIVVTKLFCDLLSIAMAQFSHKALILATCCSAWHGSGQLNMKREGKRICSKTTMIDLKAFQPPRLTAQFS